MFFKTCNFVKKRLEHRCFPVKLAKLLGTSFFHRTSKVAAFVFSATQKNKMKKKETKWNKMNIKWKNVITWAYSLESTSDGVLFSTVAALTAYNFMKMGLHIRFCEFCEVLQNHFLRKTTGRLLPIFSNISDISLALLAINQFCDNWMSA